jgi:hypothetical protein
MFEGHSVPGDLFWILLTEEARAAGIRVPNEEVGKLLEGVIPQLFKSSYAQVMPSIMNRFNVSEGHLTTFGNCSPCCNTPIASPADLTRRDRPGQRGSER